MNDSEWLNRIRRENRQHLGLEGLRGAVIDAPAYRVVGRSGSSARPTPVVQPAPSLRGLGTPPTPGPAPLESYLGLAGLACLVGALTCKNKRVRRNLGVAGAALLLLPLVAKKSA